MKYLSEEKKQKDKTHAQNLKKKKRNSQRIKQNKESLYLLRKKFRLSYFWLSFPFINFFCYFVYLF